MVTLVTLKLNDCSPGPELIEPGPRPVSRPQLPLPVAGGSRGVDLVRDGSADPRLVRAHGDGVGAVPGGLRRAAVDRVALLAVLRHRRRPRGTAHAPLRHARRLR